MRNALPGIGVLHPMLGEAIAVIEVVVVLAIIGTALFGSPALSERAFRLLRWSGNRPEPPGPAPRGWDRNTGEGGREVVPPLFRADGERAAGRR